MRMPTTTMVSVLSNNPAETVLGHLLKGEWFLPDPDIPACGTVLYVPADQTKDFVERMFICDLPADHPESQHRQVTDVTEGQTITWATGRDENSPPGEQP